MTGNHPNAKPCVKSVKGKKMIETTYTCDKCGNEQHNPEADQFWAVEVIASPFKQSYMTGSRKSAPRHYCRGCVLGLGLVPPNRAEEKPETVPTVEELIGEIIERCSE